MTSTQPGVANKVQLEQDIVDSPQPKEGDKGNIEMLLYILHTPILSLVEEYLGRSNGDMRKSTQKCMSEFKSSHSVCFFFAFFFDLIFRLFGISIVVAVLLRGLGVINF